MRSESSPAEAVEVDGSRYHIESKLGEGGTGAVFLARDRETGDRVALKKLFRMDAKSVLRLKREFRSLVDVTHPNLVRLFDMGRAPDCWFLTMEYLQGVDLTAYVTGEDAEVPATLTPEAAANDNQRLVSSLQQLAHAIHALHQAGMLHRDLKPSNVMVVGERVVVLDFGLVRELNRQAATVTEDGAVAGTPAYMAPEQLLGETLDAACDWYAFGVIMYELLSGVLPIDGSIVEILRQKLDSEPTPLRELAPDVPEWMNELCMGLLRRAPSARPSGEQVLAALDRALRPRAAPQPLTAAENTIVTENETRSLPLFGRHAELRELWRAVNEAERGQQVVAHVRGLSGTGKSALVERFLDELEARGSGEALVLRSRCYELEQMPFKALDGVLDALVHHLTHLDDLAVAQALPHDVAALAQVFPVLERLSAVKRLTQGITTAREALNERQRAERALRELLVRVASRQPLVVWIDDLQWGDLDSARILRGWMQEPAAAPIVLLFSYRSDEAATSSCLSHLLARDAAYAAQLAREHVLELSALNNLDLRALCQHRLGALAADSGELVERIVREAAGSPFLASQLTAMAEAKLARGDLDLNALSLDTLVTQTGGMLSDDARKLLALLAVAGRPMTPKLALHAAAVRNNGRALVHSLRGLNLVRTRDVSGSRMLEIYHDRVRERVAAALSGDERRALNAALLSVIEFSGEADADWLLSLALAAGQRERALEYAQIAAERANKSLAFERAAEVYECWLELTPDAQRAELWKKLALALVRCGRGARAADAYLEAAKRSPAEEVQLTQHAASQLLRTGQFERGSQLMQRVLRAVGAELPESDAGVLSALVWEGTRAKWRGMKHVLRAPEDVDPQLIASHDTCISLSAPLFHWDPARSALLRVRALRTALDAGEPQRIVSAFCLAAMSVAASGEEREENRVDALIEQATALAVQLGERAHAEVSSTRAVCAFLQSRLRFVIAPSLEAERVLCRPAEHDPHGDYFRRLTLATMRVTTRCHLGQLREARAETHALAREAQAIDNDLIRISLLASRTIVDQIEDVAARSRPFIDELRPLLPNDRFGSSHAIHMTAVMIAANGTRDYVWANEYLAVNWKRWLSSRIRGSNHFSFGAHFEHAWLMLNQYFTTRKDPAFLAAAKRDIKPLRVNRMGRAGSKVIEARLAFAAGDKARAAALFRASAELWLHEGWELQAARDRFAAAALSGGSQGASEQAAALERLRELGMVNPHADVSAYIPELA